MKAIVMFYDGCIRVILDTAKRSDSKLSMAQIEMFLDREENGDIIDRINSMKFFSPIMPKDEMKRKFDDLHNAITKAFTDISTSRQWSLPSSLSWRVSKDRQLTVRIGDRDGKQASGRLSRTYPPKHIVDTRSHKRGGNTAFI